MTVSLLMDIIVALLLAATIWYAIRLNQKLGLLRADGERLERLIAGLQSASRQAEDAVENLRATAQDAGRGLQASIDRAGALKNDLGFIIEKGDSAADRLEAALKAHRESQQAQAPHGPTLSPQRGAAAPGPVAPEPRRRPSRAEVDAEDRAAQGRLAQLLKQADAVPNRQDLGRQEPILDPQRATRPAAEARREPLSDPPPRPRPPSQPPEAEPERAQSRAERDLLRALEARR